MAVDKLVDSIKNESLNADNATVTDMYRYRDRSREDPDVVRDLRRQVAIHLVLFREISHRDSRKGMKEIGWHSIGMPAKFVDASRRKDGMVGPL